MNAPAAPVPSSAAPQHRAWRRMMLALIVMTISQCCYYERPYKQSWTQPGTARTYVGGGRMADLSTNRLVTVESQGKTGWELHPRAPYLIGALFIVLGLVLDLGMWWTRWGYWMGVLGLLFCMIPFHLEEAPGYGLLFGCVALFLGISAARWRGRIAPPPLIPVP